MKKPLPPAGDGPDPRRWALGDSCRPGARGEVYHVTNLADTGPGSFGDAVARGPRFVLFDVGGYVGLRSPVHVASDLTLLGQSAPGEGVGIRNFEVSFSGPHNVIVRYLRFRQGPTPGQEKKYTLGLHEAANLIYDHVSIQFGRWDGTGLSRSRDVTFQNCLIGPGIGPQRFGCLCESENVTFSHNLWISNQSRSPKIKGHSAGDHAATLQNNYFIRGPSSNERFAGEFKPTDHLLQHGNLVDLDRDGRLNGRPVTLADFGTGPDAPTLEGSTTIHPPVPVKLDPAEAAYRRSSRASAARGPGTPWTRGSSRT